MPATIAARRSPPEHGICLREEDSTIISPRTTPPKSTLRDLPRNVWGASLASFFMDISSEMMLNLLPLFLANVLGVRSALIDVIEGVAEATASLWRLFSG